MARSAESPETWRRRPLRGAAAGWRVAVRRSAQALARLAVLGLLGTAGLVAAVAQAREEQAHGLAFERWVQDTFFDGYRPVSFTQPWDIPAEVNLTHGGIPVNPKATKYGTPIDLGDALRQFDIAEPFWLVVAFWEQDHAASKRVVNLTAVRVEPAAWRALWGDVTRADLERFDALVKDRSRSARDAQRAAQALKREAPFRRSVFVLNPKIDAQGQRRLQCSLRFADFFARLAPEASAERQAEPALWGVAFPGALPGAARALAEDRQAAPPATP